jgi:hypothetical protein
MQCKILMINTLNMVKLELYKFSEMNRGWKKPILNPFLIKKAKNDIEIQKKKIF